MYMSTRDTHTQAHICGGVCVRVRFPLEEETFAQRAANTGTLVRLDPGVWVTGRLRRGRGSQGSPK